MGGFPENIRWEIGIYVDRLVRWLLKNYGEIFDSITQGIQWFLINLEKALFFLPWWLVLILVFVIGYRIKNISVGLMFAFSVFLIGSFGFWGHMMMTLAIVLTSVVISLLLGIPTGIFMAYQPKMKKILNPILDGMQTMPSFVYLIPALMLFGMGKVPGIFATTIYAIAPVIRLTELGIQRVPKEMVEAAHSFGSSAWQTLFKVQLPQALPTIMAGVNQTTMMALSMVVVTSMIGAKGLGMEVLVAIQQVDIARGFEAGISIVILAVIIDRLTQGIANRFKYPE